MDGTKHNKGSKIDQKVEWKLYKRRWFMLFLFVCFSMGNTFQWIQYSIIANLVTKYYGVTSRAIDWTSMIFMIVFIPFIFPASMLLDKVGMRWPMILGTLGTALGACLKIASVGPDLFWVTFIGQTFVASSQVFMLSVPPTLAAFWFGAKEVSTACSIGVFGNQLGIVLGFLIPPMIVHDHDNIDDIGKELATVFYYSAGFNVAVFILTVIFFQAKPPLPPSPQQALQKQNASNYEEGFFPVIKRLFLNKSYVLLLIAYPINQGVLNAMSTLLNQLILQYFENAEEFAGRVGVTLIAAGMVGSVVFGVILDKTRKFKITTLGVYFLSLVGMIGFTYILQTKSELAVYLIVGFFGFFLEGYMPIGYDLAAEITYPEPEAMTAGLLTLAIQIYSTLITLLFGEMVRSVGPEWSNNTLSITLLIGVILHIVMKPELRRQAAAGGSTEMLVKEP